MALSHDDRDEYLRELHFIRWGGIARAKVQHMIKGMRVGLSFGFASLIGLIPALAEAAPRRYYREYEGRDYRDPSHDGLFVRGVLGVGGVTADDELNDSTLSGGAGMFSLDVGGAVAPSLALHCLSHGTMIH